MTENKIKNMYTDFVYPKYDEKWDEKAPIIKYGRFCNYTSI